MGTRNRVRPRHSRSPGIDTIRKPIIYKVTQSWSLSGGPTSASSASSATYQDFKEILVGDVGKLRTVELGDHELLARK